MWDSSFMADFDNISEMNENFNTIKTLLNSIRAQGILNTSDVDKLLSGINTKLEKLNTEEDIDLIKIFLSELKQNLDERHNVLISKFGAIESLFSNLLKNSSEMPKSTELKELFDIVATNLSVFSREVVSQKESLTDITLRLDALRSDDSQKRDIIKNIAVLKPDLERLNNGFDSIVLSLNDNFKAIIKTISSIDKTEYLDRFSDNLSGLEMSSSTLLSAIQLLDKKTEQIDDYIKNLVTKEDLISTNQKLFELNAHSQELTAIVRDLSDRYLRIDNLADKIDASVNIVAGLKAVLEESDDKNTAKILEQVQHLEQELKSVNTESLLDNFKLSLEEVIKNISETSSKEVLGVFSKNILELKEHINDSSQKITSLEDAHFAKVLEDISLGANSLNSGLLNTQTAIANLLEKNFSEIFENVNDLRTVVSQVDENSVSANNAIFSSISDRLSVFETSLKDSLEIQENTIATSSAKLAEQVDNIKNLSSVLDYKMDSSVVEVGNIKRGFSDLKTAVEDVLALDFVNTVKDLRVDLYAAKKDIADGIETSGNDLSEKITNDFYGKYELLISKLDSVEDELKKTQLDSLNNLKPVLENISSSLMDVLSYVSEVKPSQDTSFGDKINDFSEILKENSMDYVDSVRDIVDTIRVQVDNNLKSIEESNLKHLDSVKNVITENADDLKKELKYSYSKLLELIDSYKEVKELLNLNEVNNSDKYEELIAASEGVKSEFESKLSSFKSALLDKITDFKQEFTCENADKTSELKFYVENLYNKNYQEVSALLEEIKSLLSGTSTDDMTSRAAALAKILDNFVSLKEFMNTLNTKAAQELGEKVDIILNDFSSLKTVLDRVDENIDGDMTRQLSIIESNFESLVSQITILFDKSDKSLSDKIKDEFSCISDKMDANVAEKLESYKLKIEQTFDSLEKKSEAQSEYLKDRITDLNTSMKTVWERQSEENLKRLEGIANNIKDVLDDNIERSTVDYASLANQLSEFIKNIETNNNVLAQDLKAQLDDITKYIDSVLDIQAQEVSAKYDEFKLALNNTSEKLNTELSDVKSLNMSLKDSVENIYGNIKSSVENVQNGMKSISGNILSNLGSVKDTLVNSIAEMGVNNIELKGMVGELTNSFDSAADNLVNQIKEQQNLQNITAANLETNIKDSAKQLLNEVVTSNGELKKQNEDLSSLVQSASDKMETLQASNNTALIEMNNKVSDYQHDTVIRTENIMQTAMRIESVVSATSDVIESNSNNIVSLAGAVSSNKERLEKLQKDLDEKYTALRALTTEISAGELQTLDSYIEGLSVQLEAEKENIQICKNLITEFMKKELDILSKNIEKETDIVIGELVEQFDLLKKSQSDDIVSLTSGIEDIISSHVYNNIEDLKSYLDIKTDNSILIGKLDNLKVDLSCSLEDVMSNISKMLDAGIFNTAIADFRLANEILVNTAADRLNEKIENFINENITTIADVLTTNNAKIEDKLALFDKRFVDTIVDKFEEVKLISNRYNDSFNAIDSSIKEVIGDFSSTKTHINNKIENLIAAIKDSADTTNKEVSLLRECFDNLRSQISNKSFDEAFQASINKQIASLEDLIDEQFGYIEDISELCVKNLPDISELSMIVKHSILEDVKQFSQKLDSMNIEESIAQHSELLKNDILNLSDKLDSFDLEETFSLKTDLISDDIKNLEESLSEKIDSQDIEGIINKEFKGVKTDIITQFLNIFNQISFVTEQEEILDFIQEKHDELITVLSHIVTTSEDVSVIRDNVSDINFKIGDLKDEITLINEKITAIMSSEGDIDYVYSLQDLESDIANLRMVLNDIKSNDHSSEFNDLINSTNNIYSLVESIKTELPGKRDIESIAEDIVSISTRTNKLILASDESYKTLQDNLQDFKLVINDLDERTKNFAQESGMDRIDTKLNALNAMLQNGAKTNQVFNQIFEYLAEWVDNASVQINSISDKITPLDELSQIKGMLEDIKAGAEDNTETVELVEALGAVFDKQTKKISSLETKLDKIIVETTINNRNNKLDLAPLENTLNSFLVAMDEKMAEQQTKIEELESKLKEMTDTTQLTKKMGGMDRQIAKLNKSIEKIAGAALKE